MSLTALPEQVLSWLATFALHSTLLLSLALLSQRWLRRRSLRLAEQVMKIALCGGLLTATLQLALGYTPLGGKVPIEQEALPSPAFFEEPQKDGPEVVIALAGRPAVTTVTVGRARPEALPFAWPARPALPLHALGALLRGQPLSRLLLLLWGIGAAVLLLRTGARFAALSQRLAGRRRILDGLAADALTDLCAQAGAPAVLLSASPHLRVPIARGLLSPEICLPARALDLPEEQLRGILAHELSHLCRRDPVWLAALAVLESALFFQPLLRLCRIRMQEISEYLCDDFSVEHTGEGLALARCLTEVAGWVLGERDAALVPGMASGVLSQRVQRLLSLHPQGRGLPPRGVLPICVAVLFAIAACAPSISTARRALAVKEAEAAEREHEHDHDHDTDVDDDDHEAPEVEVDIDVPRPPRPPRPPLPPRFRPRVRVHVPDPAESAEQERALRQELTKEKERFLKELPTQQQLAKIKEKAQALARAIEEQKEEEQERLEQELESLTEGLRPNEEAMTRMQHLAQRLAHVASRRAHAAQVARELQAQERREERREGRSEGRSDDEERQRLDEERRRLHDERKRLEEERRRLEEERRRLEDAQKQVGGK